MLEDAKHLARKARRAVLKRVQYALMRNLRPRNADEKRLLAEGPKVLSNSMPKAGTNLLSRLMQMLPNTVDRWSYHIDETLPGIERQLRAGRRGQVISAHFPYDADRAALLRDLDYRLLMMVRDPRDIALSNVNYVTRMDLSHPMHRTMAELPDDDARLMMMIEPPEQVLATLPEVWRNEGHNTFLPWLDEPNCLIVRFEDLVGARGGGSDAVQRDTVAAIAAHIGADLPDTRLNEICDQLFGNSGSKTFHKGQIGGWHEDFKPHHREAFKRRSGQALIRMGYETSLDW